MQLSTEVIEALRAVEDRAITVLWLVGHSMTDPAITNNAVRNAITSAGVIDPELAATLKAAASEEVTGLANLVGDIVRHRYGYKVVYFGRAVAAYARVPDAAERACFRLLFGHPHQPDSVTSRPVRMQRTIDYMERSYKTKFNCGVDGRLTETLPTLRLHVRELYDASVRLAALL